MFAVDVPFSFAWVDSATSVSGGTPSETYSHNTAGEDIDVEKLDTGRYSVNFEGLVNDLPAGGNVQVSGYGGNHVCSIDGWFENGEDVDAYVNCYDTNGDLTDGRFDISVIGRDNGAGMAFAWVQGTTGTFDAASYYAHNEQGGISIENTATGQYAVTFEGQGDLIGGNVQVSGYGGPVNASVTSWQSNGGDLIANVEVREVGSGDLVNSRFSIAVVPEEAGSSSGIAYAWASNPSQTQEPVSSTYSDNPAGPAIDKQRVAEGVYQVTFEDFNGLADAGGHIMVTPYGGASRIASVAGWSSSGPNIVATINTYDLAGNAADANFTILATPTPQPVPESGGFSYAWIDTPGDASSTPSIAYSYNAAGGDIEVTRNGEGDHFVLFEDISSSYVDGGNVQVTPYGSSGNTCTLASWAGIGDDLRAHVRCFDAAGAAADTQFNIAAIDDANNADIAYAWMGATDGVTYSSDDTWAYNPEGDIVFTRSSVGQYQATFQGLGNDVTGGHVQVTPYGIARSAVVRSWGTSGDDLVVNLATFDSAGNPVDGRLSVAVIPPTENPDVGYAWTGNAAVDELDLDGSLYAHHPNEGDIEKTRVFQGTYDVRFNGINSFEDVGGHVMVTPYGSTHHATVSYWSSGGPSGDMVARVVTRDADGNPVDGRFTIAIVGVPAKPGDFTGDNVVDGEDIADLCQGMDANDLDYDLNNDGVVDQEDMDQLIHDVLNTHYGDANLDGVFDTADLVQIFAAGKYETGNDAVWAEGDFNCDSLVDTSDLVVALADGGYVG